MGYELLNGAQSELGSGDGDGDGDGDGGAGGESAGDGDGDETSGGAGGGSSSGGAAVGGMGGLGSETPVDCPMSALFCSGFEPPILSQWDQLQTGSGAQLRRVDSPTFGGSRALLASGNATTGVSRVEYVFDSAIRSGSLSIRAFFYVPSSTTIEGPIEILSLRDPAGGINYKASLHLDADDAVTMEATTGVTPPTTTTSAGAFGRDSWHCAALRLEVEDPGAIEIDINGAFILSNLGGDTHPADGFSRAFVGFSKSNHPEVELYIDDVTISTEHLGCL